MTLKRKNRLVLFAANLRDAKAAARLSSACGRVGLEHLLTATSALARARVHTAHQYEVTTKKARNMWGAYSAVEKEVAKAQRNFASRCVIERD